MSETIVKTCEHLKTNGDRCGSPALSEKKFCHFHDRYHDLNDMPGNPDFMPLLEDHLSIQLFIMQVAKAQSSGSITPHEASAMLALAKAAMSNLRLAKIK